MKKAVQQTYPLPEESLAASAALRNFRQPDRDARPMARMWFPDAGAGEREDDCILEQFQSMAAGGISGVEVALLGDDTGNLDAENYGWGTPNWVKTMKKVLRAADKIPGGFRVDFTITSHWPPIVNTIDPNDAAASSNMVFTYKKLRPEDGIVELPLPETELYDSGRNPFIFKDTLCGAVVATVADMPLPELKPMGFGPMDQNTLHHFGPERTMFDGKIMQGGGGFPPMDGPAYKVPFVLELASLENVTDRTEAAPEKGWPCGVPDQAALDRWYPPEITAEQVEAVFGPPADEADLLPDGKRDRNLNRKRMADFQPVWQLNAAGLASAASAGDALLPGDRVVIACYYRGTGQIFSGGFQTRLMKNMTYAANYFTEAGTAAITDYWDTYMLSDPELRNLMETHAEKTGGSIFEDSIELHSNGANWAAEFNGEMDVRMGCDAVRYMPVYLGLYFDDAAGVERVLESYRMAEGGMYQTHHIEALNRWAAGFGYTYRAQAGMPGINITGANTATGITEGDNGTFKDANRRLAGCVNMVPEKKFHSFESNTFTGFPFPWSLLVQECHYDASTGTNRLIFHGTAYCKNVHDFYDWWPGWNWGGGGGKAYDFMAWDKRICWWDDAPVITGYLGRLCGILQNAQTKVDLAVLCSGSETMLNGDSVYGLLADHGYSYNILGDYSLTLPAAAVQEQQLFRDGPGYRAMLVKDVKAMSLATAQKLLGFAQAGLPVIFEGGLPERITGLDPDGMGDAALAATLQELLALPAAAAVENEDAVLQHLEQLGILPAARYTQHLLETTHLKDEAGEYYVFYNDTTETVHVPVCLSGTGPLLRLNCWSGEAEPVPAEQTDDVTVFDLELLPQDMKFFARLTAAEPVKFEEIQPLAAIVPGACDILLESFGPAVPGDSEYSPACPLESHRETISFTAVPMGTCWADLPASVQQLQRLRVAAMQDVSGRSWYTVSFTLPADTAQIEISCLHGERDFLVGGTLNGMPLQPVSCMEDRLTVSQGLRAGENTLTLALDSVLTNRLNYESPGFLENADLSLLSFGGGPRDYSLRWPTGIREITVTPYINIC